jgi:carbon storage regulator
MLILSRKSNQSIMIGDQVEISIVDIKGDTVKVGIKAPRDVPVFRTEVYLEIQKENQEALKTSPDTIESLGGLFPPKKDKS